MGSQEQNFLSGQQTVATSSNIVERQIPMVPLIKVEEVDMIVVFSKTNSLASISSAKSKNKTIRNPLCLI